MQRSVLRVSSYYGYKAEATQIPQDAGLAKDPHTNRKFPSTVDQTSYIPYYELKYACLKRRDHRAWIHSLTPWLMEPGGSMPHSQGLSNNPYPELNQPNYPHWYKLWSSWLRSLLHSPFSSLLGSNTRLRILFSNTRTTVYICFMNMNVIIITVCIWSGPSESKYIRLGGDKRMYVTPVLEIGHGIYMFLKKLWSWLRIGGKWLEWTLRASIAMDRKQNFRIG